jgi:MFS transporter, DHA1 family, tetracycline resistance protein
MENRKLSLLPIFVTVFIDLIGIGIVIPILAHLFLDADGILPISYSVAQRTILYGLLVASYPIAQFFGAPVLGALSDRHGRKGILILSLIGTFIGYIFFAYGIMTKNLLLLFISRIIDGFTGGNISIAMSAIADLSNHQEKAKNFGLVGMAFGLGFILGPYIGGKLSDPSVLHWFTHSTPFFFAALLSLINILLVVWMFKETLSTKIHSKISALTGMKNIYRALQMPSMRTMFLVVFLLTFGFTFYTQFFPVFLIEKFQYSQSQIGDLFAYLGLWVALTQGILTRALSKKFLPQKILTVSILGMSIMLFILILPSKVFYIYMIIPFMAMFNGITMPNTTAVISNLTAKDSQGEILGINQSIQSLAMAIPPIISGVIVSISNSLPILVASVTIFISWLVFVTLFRNQNKHLFHEI